jgi:protein required for attachment to host cells
MYELPIWILVAGNEQARFFQVNKPGGDPAQVTGVELVNPHLRSSELEDDRPGRTHDSFGAGRHAMEPGTDPQQTERQLFAREISAALLKHYQKGDYRQLYLVASPAMLGELRKQLDEQLSDKVSGVLDKDFSKMPLSKCKTQLKELTRLF